MAIFTPTFGKTPFQGATFLLESKWQLADIEAEWRAQIELAKKKIPRLSHFSGHMGCTHADPAIREMVTRLGQEYGLAIDLEEYDVKPMRGFKPASEGYGYTEKRAEFITNLKALTPGVWLFVEHPGYDRPELQQIRPYMSENIALDRDHVTQLFTDPEVKKVIAQMNIELVNYPQVKALFTE
ncbi:MAG: ChbG/HpnK family deacetylase [Bacteroidia bacterium]|nr:ChbG/HpnK family deacetylase [Bacteroidia bacterium]